ncbi:MAG: hypothetical protein WD398_04980, partial [Cyclobacteriaceae bacterium]
MGFLKKLIFFMVGLAFTTIPILANDINYDQTFRIGWATADITPEKPVLIAGQFHARLSEGVMDPVKATILAMESGNGNSSQKAIWISCDLVGISDGTRSSANIRDKIRNEVIRLEPSLSAEQIIINATHTHAAPLVSSIDNIEQVYGVSLEKMAAGGDAMQPAEYIDFAADRIAKATVKAWNNRKIGGVSLGLSHAVVGMNRLQALHTGQSVMYGNTNNQDFSHIEGHEDHSLNLMYFWDENRKLSGLIINVAAPSQVSEHSYKLSGDFWHDTREELQRRYGKDIHILGQASAAGDQSPHVMVGGKAEERMQRLLGFEEDGTGRGSLGQRKQIALRIADAVSSIYPVMKENINWSPEFAHRMEVLQLSRRLLSMEDVEEAQKEAEVWQERYQEMLKDIEENPEKTKEPRWYRDITISHSRLKRGLVVKERYELEKKEPKMPIEVHVLRVGDAVFATNPFELYLDYGMQMKARS